MNTAAPADFDPQAPLMLGSAARTLRHALSDLAAQRVTLLRETDKANFNACPPRQNAGRRMVTRALFSHLAREAQLLRISDRKHS